MKIRPLGGDIIGMRVNKWWKVHKWLPVIAAMPRMLKELAAKPEAGLLGVQSMGFSLVQYWRSFDSSLVPKRLAIAVTNASPPILAEPI